MDNNTLNVLINGICGLIGTLLGAAIATIVTWKLKTKEARIRILEKTFDRRLQAHESLLEVVGLLRTTVSTKEINAEHTLITFPAILDSKERFTDYMFNFFNCINPNSHWFDQSLVKEINLLQDFNINIERTIKDMDDDQMKEFGKLVKSDFIVVADRLERAILKFFEKDITDIKISTSLKTIKYSQKETLDFFRTLKLFNHLK